MPILLADCIGKSFGQTPVLTSATLKALPSRITVLLGRNGAGKSTLIRIAAGWMRADYGLIVFKGERIMHPQLADLAMKGLFYLPQRSLLCLTLSLSQHLSALAQRFPIVTGEMESALRLLRLVELADQQCANLSGGERRRAEIALALIRRPVCLLADEPFHGIAPTDIELLSECFRELAKGGTAIVITGHEVPSLLDIANDVVWQTGGTTRFLGSRDAALTNHQFVREYLGPGVDVTPPVAPVIPTDRGI